MLQPLRHRRSKPIKESESTKELKVTALLTAPRHEIVFARNYIEIALRHAGVPLAVSGGVFYGLVGAAPWGYWICILVFTAHLFGGTEWVLSAVLLQQRTEDRYRGRVFATEFLLLMLANSLSIFLTSLLIEIGVLTPRTAVQALALLLVVLGTAWSFWAVPAERSEALVAHPSSKS